MTRGGAGPVVVDRELTRDEARAIVGWSYDPPFDVYDLTGPDAVATLTRRDEQGHGYYPVCADGDLVGFLCFGPEARVQGQREEPGTCDIGAGVRPDRVSQGLASTLVPSAVAFAHARFGARRLRVAVAAFNERSLRLCAAAGFTPVRELTGPGGRPFVELVLERSSPA